MGEHHRLDQADAGRDPGCEQRRDRRKQIRAEENGAQSRRIQAETEMKPPRREALHHETAPEGVDGEKAGQLEHQGAGGLAERRFRGRRSARFPLDFRRRRDAAEQQREHASSRRVEGNDHPLARQGRDRRPPERRDQQARG